MFNHSFNKQSALRSLALLALAVVFSGSAWAQYSIQVLSSRADTITGGDALVQGQRAGRSVTLEHLLRKAQQCRCHRHVPGRRLAHQCNAARPGQRHEHGRQRVGRRYQGQWSGARQARGEQLFDQRADFHGHPGAALHLSDAELRAACASGGTLGPAIDAFCNAPTVIRYVYRTTTNTTAALTDFSALPANVAMTTTVTGQTVPLYRARRDRHDEPRHLSERDPAQSNAGRRSCTQPIHSTTRLEQAPDRGARCGLPRRLVRPRLRAGSHHVELHAAWRRLRAVQQYAQPSVEQLQSLCRGRNHFHGQGAFHRDFRRALVHHQHGQFRRRVYEPAGWRRVSRIVRRRLHQPAVPGCAHSSRPPRCTNT